MAAKPTKTKKKSVKTQLGKAKVKSKATKVLSEGLKGVDSNLLKLPPKLQSNIDQVLKSLDVSPIKLQDLRSLGYRILKHAAEISETLKRAPVVGKRSRGRKV